MKHVIRLIAVFLLVSFATNAYCAESELSGYVDLIKKVDENFFDGILCDSCNTTTQSATMIIGISVTAPNCRPVRNRNANMTIILSVTKT